MAILMAAVFILPIVTVSISFNDGVEAAATDVIVVETSPDFAPYDYYYGTEFVGIDMDILRAIGMDTGYSIQFKQNRFDSRFNICIGCFTCNCRRVCRRGS